VYVEVQYNEFMPVVSRRSPGKPASKAANLMIRVDTASKGIVTRAAKLRGVSTSDYVREVVVSQARREVGEARTRTLLLSPEDQLAFWRALKEPVALTKRQVELSRLMRGS
jgi:uncharacterized protein (DUF1778 family)